QEKVDREQQVSNRRAKEHRLRGASRIADHISEEGQPQAWHRRGGSEGDPDGNQPNRHEARSLRRPSNGVEPQSQQNDGEEYRQRKKLLRITDPAPERENLPEGPPEMAHGAERENERADPDQDEGPASAKLGQQTRERQRREEHAGIDARVE